MLLRSEKFQKTTLILAFEANSAASPKLYFFQILELCELQGNFWVRRIFMHKIWQPSMQFVLNLFVRENGGYNLVVLHM